MYCLPQVARTKATAQRILAALNPPMDPLRCPPLAQQARSAGAREDVGGRAGAWWLLGGDAGRAAATAEIKSIKAQRQAAKARAEVRGCSPTGIRRAPLWPLPASTAATCSLSIHAVE